MATNFNDLAKRAEKRAGNRSDYVLVIGDGEPDVVISKPDAIQAMQSEQAGSMLDQIRILTGTEYPRILDLLKGRDIRVAQDLVTDMWRHWDGDAHEVPGGKEV